MNYLNEADGQRATDLAFDVKVIDSNGDCLARVERQGDHEYQLIPGESY